MKETGNKIVDLSFQFAFKIIKICEILEFQNKKTISNQLLKSGTSIGANIREAQHAESKIDFIHKLKIAAKEANETEYWLLLIAEVGYLHVENQTFDLLIQIQRLLSTIISKSKKSI